MSQQRDSLPFLLGKLLQSIEEMQVRQAALATVCDEVVRHVGGARATSLPVPPGGMGIEGYMPPGSGGGNPPPPPSGDPWQCRNCGRWNT